MQHPQQIAVSQIQFIGEQDGAPERELKDRLADFFRRDRSVKVAYLARVTYGDPSSVNVALCLQTQFGRDPGLAEKVMGIFTSMFGRHEHMDLIFLTEQRETQLAKVCAAFFNASNARPEPTK